MEKSSFFSGIYFSGLGIGIGIVAVFTLTLTNNNPSNEPNKYSKQHFDHVTHKRIIPMLGEEEILFILIMLLLL